MLNAFGILISFMLTVVMLVFAWWLWFDDDAPPVDET